MEALKSKEGNETWTRSEFSSLKDLMCWSIKPMFTQFRRLEVQNQGTGRVVSF